MTSIRTRECWACGCSPVNEAIATGRLHSWKGLLPGLRRRLKMDRWVCDGCLAFSAKILSGLPEKTVAKLLLHARHDPEALPVASRHQSAPRPVRETASETPAVQNSFDERDQPETIGFFLMQKSQVAETRTRSQVAYDDWREANDSLWWVNEATDKDISHVASHAVDLLCEMREQYFKAFNAMPIENLRDCMNHLNIALVQEREMKYPEKPERNWKAIERVIAHLDETLNRTPDVPQRPKAASDMVGVS